MSILREELITNHLLLDYFDLWDEFDIKSANDTYEVRYYNQLMNLINGQLDAGIRWLDSEEAREYFFGESEYQTEVFRALEDEWDSILEGKYSSVDALLSEVYRRGKAKGYTDMRERIQYTESDKQALQIALDYNYHLIRKIDNDTRNQIKNKITEAVIAGEHPTTVAPKILNIAEERLHDSNFTPKQRATMIARTEVSRVQNTGILQSYINEGYSEVKILTAEDNNVCDLCLRYAFEFNEDDKITFENRGDEQVHNIIKLVEGGLFPPFHPLCRCTYLSVWESKGKPSKNPYIIDLSPTAYADNVPKKIKPTDDPVVIISRERIKNSLENIVEGNDELISIVNLLDNDFRFNVKNNSYEWGAGIGKNWEYQTTYKGKRNKTPLSNILLKARNKEGILFFVHSHPVTTSPLASWEDYKLFAENKIEYSIITNEFGMLIIKNKNVEKSLKDVNNIEDISSEIQRNLTSDFQNYIEYLDKYENQKWLSDVKYDEKFHEFTKENHDYYFDKYQLSLNEYFDITFINPE